jgi:DNA polymerase III subunit gamma/tau
MLGMDLPAAPARVQAGAYRVLARKYRPQKFSELIGQDALVQTLSNAIARDRLAHAFLMTGVRGVGKTTTARLIAKGLNCIGADGQGGPTIDPCGVCEPCVAIAEGRHIDVIEMDAASHTGVDDVREIIEAVRYAAVSARYKIYIIDEVHMLSKNAFNALLKTLEEPPPHVKFLFATTEVNKVPVTVLSRCQRFDLRRITPDLLFAHFHGICAAEGVAADEDALRLIAAAAEGSARDGLSILDQAMAHADLDSGSRISAGQVRDMLGVADGAVARDLMAAVLAGESVAAIDLLRAAYARGMDPLAQVRALMSLAHGIALARISRGGDPAMTPEDRAAVDLWAQQIGMARAQRLWQLLLRAHEEVARANDAQMAAEMAILRLIHAGTLPDPDELARLLKGQGDGGAGPEPMAQAVAPFAAPAAPPTISAAPVFDAGPEAVAEPAAPPAAEPVLAAPAASPARGPTDLSIVGIAKALGEAGQHRAASLLRREGRLVAVAAGNLTLERSTVMDDAAAEALQQALSAAFGAAWAVTLANEGGAPTLGEQGAATAAAHEAALRAHPLVDATLRQFPDGEFRPPAAA